MRGRKPKPVAQLPGAQSVPSRPTALMGKPVAIAAWKRIVGELVKRGLWGNTVEDTVVLMANACERYAKMEEHIAEHGEVILDLRGSMKSNPAVRIQKMAEDTILKGLEQLGLTPTSMSKASGDSDGEDELLGLLKNLKGSSGQ